MNGQCMLFLEKMKKVCDFTVWDLRPVRVQESLGKDKNEKDKDKDAIK